MVGKTFQMPPGTFPGHAKSIKSSQRPGGVSDMVFNFYSESKNFANHASLGEHKPSLGSFYRVNFLNSFCTAFFVTKKQT